MVDYVDVDFCRVGEGGERRESSIDSLSAHFTLNDMKSGEINGSNDEVNR